MQSTLVIATTATLLMALLLLHCPATTNAYPRLVPSKDDADDLPFQMDSSQNADGDVVVQRRELSMCAKDPQMRDMCELCAKITKAPRAYKLCCKDEGGAKKWCDTFLHVGPSWNQ